MLFKTVYNITYLDVSKPLLIINTENFSSALSRIKCVLSSTDYEILRSFNMECGLQCCQIHTFSSEFTIFQIFLNFFREFTHFHEIFFFAGKDGKQS
jgi:hypothetical protein